jgi:small-conductance mechanosensitive channel
MINEISEWIAANLNLSPAVQVRLLESLLLIIALVVYRYLLRRFVARREIEDPNNRYRWRKTGEYIGNLLFVIIAAQIWTEQISSLATYLGLVSAGLAVALSDPLVNLAGWAFIIFRHPFDIGDRIEIGGTAGDVIDIRYFQFTLVEIGNWVQADQSTGRIVHVPNRRIFSEHVANYTAGFSYIWHEIPVLITFESDWRRAKEVLQQILDRQLGDVVDNAERARRSNRQDMVIKFGKLTPIVYTAVEASGVALTMRFLVHPRHRRSTEERLWEAILDAFHADESLNFAYPTQRIIGDLNAPE